MALKAPPEAGYNSDLMIGFAAGIAGILFVITVVLELTGQPALTWALFLAASVALLAVLIVRRRRRHAAVRETGATRQD
ncbi:hypothetical protein [Pseudolysinimonas sp.]|uniref:hypothetical protein n=1 Tax=Pseudolysinimonas sp. TaxID=2680009 RepID=UPI003F7DA14C